MSYVERYMSPISPSTRGFVHDGNHAKHILSRGIRNFVIEDRSFHLEQVVCQRDLLSRGLEGMEYVLVVPITRS